MKGKLVPDYTCGYKYRFLRYTQIHIHAADSEVPNVTIFDLLNIISRVHEDACAKYGPYSWESDLSIKTDSSARCNLDAIWRHTYRIASGIFVDSESHLSHASHLLCRLQMYITALIRVGHRKNLSSDLFEDANFCARLYRFVTPEMILLLAYVVDNNELNRSIAKIVKCCKSHDDVVRRWMIAYIFYSESLVNISNVEERDVPMSVVTDFARDLIAFCCVELWHPELGHPKKTLI